MRDIFFYSTGIAYACGIFLRSFFDIGYTGSALMLLIGGALFIVWRIKTLGFDAPLFLVALTLMVCSFGALRLEYAESYVSPLNTYEGKNVVLEGIIVREPEFREKTVHLYVKPELDGSKELILVTADKFLFTHERISYGDLVRTVGTLKKPESFMTDGGREFDYLGYLRAKGVHFTVSYAQVGVIGHDVTILEYLYRGKHSFMNAVESGISEPMAGLGEGLLLGVKRALSEELEVAFRDTGIIHIVVLSGYNMMIVVDVVMYVLGLIFFPKTRMVLGIILVVLFALLVGPSATVIRAGIMASLLVIARCTGRTHAVLRALTLAFVLMLAWNPYLLVHDIGFQLSFLATLGLILFSPHIEKRIGMVTECFGIRGFLTATISAQIAVLPLLLYHTGIFSTVSILVNVLVLPMVPVAMLLTFFTGISGLVSEFFGMIFGSFAYLSLLYIVSIAKAFSTLPFAAFITPKFPFWITVCSYVLIAYGYLRIIKKDDSHELDNPYADWIIEEEKENADEVHGTSSAFSPLPFR